MIQNLLTNWKTTSAGLTMLIGAWVHMAFVIKAHTANETDWTTALIATVAGVGLIAAGDAGTSATKVELATTRQEAAKAIETSDTTTLKKTETKP